MSAQLGALICYRGTASSCEKFAMDAIDFAFAKQRPDGALWSNTPQSSVVLDRTRPRPSLADVSRPTIWAPNTAYAAAASVMSPGPTISLGMRVYKCLVAGTSSASGNGPVGMGEVIVDGSVVWSYVADSYGG